MNQQAGEVFQDLEIFSERIRKIIPYYDLALNEISRRTALQGDRILEFGSGTGELTLKILADNPAAEIYAIDYSERMHEFLSQKLIRQKLQSRLSLERQDLSEFSASSLRQHRSFDSCISSFTIHHLPDTRKEALFREARKLLKPGAGFWIADSFDPESRRSSGAYRDARSKWMQDHGTDEATIKKGMVLPKPFGKSENHHRSSISTYRKLLEAAGFVDYETVFKYYGIAVCCAFCPEN